MHLNKYEHLLKYAWNYIKQEKMIIKNSKNKFKIILFFVYYTKKNLNLLKNNV